MNLRLPNGIEKIDRIIEGYQTYQALLAALDLGLFEFIDTEGPSDRNKIVQGIGINGMFSRDYFGTLVDMGFLSRNGEQYANTKATTDFLITRSPFFQGNFVQKAREDSHWNNLSGTLRCEQPAADKFHEAGSASFMDACGRRALRGELQFITEAVSNWDGFYSAKSLLDLGGENGLYAIALCQTHPHLNGTVLDRPHLIENTIRYIKDNQMEDRLSAQTGDIGSDGSGSGFDIVIVSHLFYQFRKCLEEVFGKVCSSLNPGGLLVTNHWFCAPGCELINSGVQELSKAMRSFGHPLCHVEEFDKLFYKNGFKILSKSVLPCNFGSSRLHLAVKESQQPECSSPSSGCCR